MADSLGDRVDELRDEARERGLDDSAIDAPDVRVAIDAYADLLGLSDSLVLDLSLSIPEIRSLGELV